MSIELLLKETARAGAWELRLLPGRGLIIIGESGEREVKNSAKTAAEIHELISAVMPPDAKRLLAGGRADWRLRHATLGDIHATVEIRSGEPHATFRLASSGRARPAREVVQASVRYSPPEREIDRLFLKMIEMGASG